MCSKLSIKTPEWRHWRRSGVFIINFEHFHTLSIILKQRELYESKHVSEECRFVKIIFIKPLRFLKAHEDVSKYRS